MMDNNVMHSVIFFAVDSLAMLGQLADCRTTEVGLAHGFAEGNSFAAKIYSKIGSAGFYALKCMVLPFAAALTFGFEGWAYGVVVAVPFAAIGFIAGIKNYLLLKKSGIGFSEIF